MPQNIPKTSSLTAVILIVFLIIGGYYTMSSLYPNYQASQGAYNRAQETKTGLEQALASVHQFVNDFENQKADASRTNMALPNNEDVANLVSSLSQIATQSGVVLSNFQIQPPPEGTVSSANSIQVEDISMSAFGSYLQFKDFVQRLEHHLRIIDVYNVTLISGTASNNPNASLQYQIKLRAYYQK